MTFAPLRTLRLRTLFVALVIMVPLLASEAKEAQLSREQALALVATLKYREGEILLPDNLATVRVPDGLKFLDGTDANTVLVKLWGNPPQPNPLGLLMPAGVSPLSEECWAVIITYEEGGYVKDSDAEKIDYADLLTQMQKDAVSANAEREKEGYPSIHLVGWAKTPHYDRGTHKLYWAKQLRFGNGEADTLNYNIRMLGRRGVLVLNVVAGMSQLPQIEAATPRILEAVDFTPGQRYTDFNPRSDKVATYGLAALVAGGVAAKLGFFKGIWIALLAAKKFVIVGVVAVTAWVRKLFGKKNPPPGEAANSPSN